MNKITQTLERITELRAEILIAHADLCKYAGFDASNGGRNTGLSLADKGVKIAELEGKLDVLHTLEYILLEPEVVA